MVMAYLHKNEQYLNAFCLQLNFSMEIAIKIFITEFSQDRYIIVWLEISAQLGSLLFAIWECLT